MDSSKGLYSKYEVRKNGVLISDRFFVLIPSKDPLALMALVYYASLARTHKHNQLANDLYNWIEEIKRG